MKKLMWTVLAVLLLATVATAQDNPTAEVATGYSHFHIIKGFTIPLDGVSSSAAVNVNSWLGVAGDFGVYRSHGGTDLTATTYTFGPRVSYRKAERVTPFAQALFGGTHFSSAVGGVSGPGGGSGSHFAVGLGGGADIALGRSGALALRPEAEYFGVRVNGSNLTNVRLGVGLVYRIGRR